MNEGKDDHESLQFLFSGENNNFKNKLFQLQLEKNNEAFIEFLLSKFCARIMKEDKLKIHIESGDTYFDGFNTGETIFDFLKMQQNEDKISIEYDFYYNDSYSDYFKRYINNIDGKTNATLDLLTNRNAKYLFYRFNDILLNAGIYLIKVKHSEKIKDKFAIVETEKTDWQYFITRLLDIIWNNEISDTMYIPEDTKTVQDYIKNLIITKKAYDKFYTSISSVFTPIIKNLPPEEKEEIQKELMNNGIQRLDFMSEIEDSSFLNIFVHFYFETGRFPDNARLMIPPRPILPQSLQNTVPIKL